MEPGCGVENEDVVGAAPTGDAPTTSEWSTIVLPTKVQLILETWRYAPFRLNEFKIHWTMSHVCKIAPKSILINAPCVLWYDGN